MPYSYPHICDVDRRTDSGYAFRSVAHTVVTGGDTDPEARSMSQKFVPTSPAEDIAAWARNRASGVTGLLTADLVAFVQSGVTVSLGGQDLRGWPLVGSGVGCRVLGGNRLRVLCKKSGNQALLDALAAQGPLAVTFTAARDHRACQVKTRQVAIVPSISDDLPEMDRQTGILHSELIALGIPPNVVRDFIAFEPGDLVALEFFAEQLYSQTPGPGAGAELK